MKKFLFYIGNILFTIYIWFLVLLIIFILCYYEINLLFAVEFLVFLISVYLFALNIQDQEKENKTKKLNIKLCKILLYYSGIYTFFMYLYQVIFHDLFDIRDEIYLFNNRFLNNLPNIGFTKYPENILYYKLIPFFSINFLYLLYKLIIQNGFNSSQNEKITINIEPQEKILEENEVNISEKYKRNEEKIAKLQIKSILINIILILTKFYWLFIFIIVCILFTMSYLIFGLIIYMIIYGYIFIFMFNKIITSLIHFLQKDSYFLSKVIRYSLIEKKSHIEQNNKYRKKGFRILFGVCNIYLIIFYLSGVFYLFENGCNEKYWKGCDNHHLSLFNKDNIYIKNMILSINYLFGFYVKLENKGVLSAARYNIFLFLLIAFDIYIEKLEIFFTDLSLKYSQKYKKLLNQNIKLKPLLSSEEKNFVGNPSTKIDNNVISENNNFENLEKKYKNLLELIDNRIKVEINYEEKQKGKKYLLQFLEAFHNICLDDEIKLSEASNKEKIIKVIKIIYEEIIIFLLICTAISKLNIWSFIYMLFSLILILTKKSIRKYYLLFCFLLVAIIFQNIIFVTNIKYETDPGKTEDILNIIKNTLNIPWYVKYTDDKNGFFFGCGVNRIQINLMWMDYIEIIIIYIYLEYFSYSLYQDTHNKGIKKKGFDKISYYNLHNNPKVIKAVNRLNLNQFQKYKKCMKINFGIDLGDYESFKDKILLTLPKKAVIELKEIRPKSFRMSDYFTENNSNIKNANTIHKRFSKDNIISKSHLLSSSKGSKKLFGKKSNSKIESNKEEDLNYLDVFKTLIYLSFHNIILISILVTSMLISGLLSIFYIIYSLIFLSKSNSMYMGEPYYYPRTIKTVLRVAILLDITIQALYQTPYLSPDPKGSGLYTILEIIGFNKIIFFEDNSAEKFDISLKEMSLVFAKAFTYFFMSIQILIYSSQDFQEFYLTYLLTKNFKLRKISLMNVFRFNNMRIESMTNALNLRQEKSNSMNYLKKILEKWNQNLFSLNPNKEKNVDNIDDINKKYLPEKIVKEKIKSFIFGGKLIKFQLWLHKNASSYSYIDKGEKDTYKKEVIQGRTTITSMLEYFVEKQLDNIDLANFTSDDMIQVKKYFYENEELNKNEIKDTKFESLEKFFSNELLIKYLKTSYIIKCIFKDIFSSCINHFHWLCYFIMLLNHIFSNSLLSLFYPLSIFLFAILEYPRPSKKYWNLCLIYTVLIIAIKFTVQLELFVKIFEEENNKDAEGKIINKYGNFIINNLHHYKIGIRFYESTSSFDFFNYIIFDALVIIILLINNYILVSRGLWVKKENEIEDIYQALERIASTKHIKLKSKEEIKSFNSLWMFDNKITSQKKRITGLFHKSHISVLNIIKSNYNESLKSLHYMKPLFFGYYKENKRNYYEKLFPKIRNEKPGNDFYVYYTLDMFLIIIFLILYYTDMNMDKTFNAVSIDSNQFSEEMIIFLIVHIIFLVFDRIIYLNQNRNDLLYDYIIYNKINSEPITEKELNEIKEDIKLNYSNKKFEKDKFIIPNEYIEKLKDCYNVVQIQIEKFNFPLLQKYILHIIITLFSHVLIFFYLPMKGNYNISRAIYCIEGEECNDFLYNKKIIMFYILYIIYLIYSSLQIKYGFYDMKRKSILKSGNSTISSGIYSAFKAIPFLYEIKLAIDWSNTPTSLDLFQWNKFENIYDTIYITYCSMTSKNEQFIGKKIQKFKKIGLGGVFSFGLILLLVIPIILFSSLNPTNEFNNLTGGTLKIDLSFQYKAGNFKNYTLYENTKPESIEQISEKEWNEYKFSESIETKNFQKAQVQKLTFFTQSERNWKMTKPYISNLINTLENLVDNKTDIVNKVFIVMDYSFIRNLPIEARIVSKRLDKIIYDYKKELIQQIKDIKDILLNCDNETFVSFEKMYASPHHLTANINPEIIHDENYDFTQGIELGFTGCTNYSSKEISYLKSFFILKKIKKDISVNEDLGLFFFVFSDKISSSTSGYSVISFYLTFILIIGNYIRNFFSGQAEKVNLTEMPNPEEIINLCEGILTSRHSFDFEQEEELYYILIEIMRSPDYLKILTNSSIDQFKKRRNMTLKDK